MDKELLIKALIEFYNLSGMPTNDIFLDDQFEQLCDKIKNGRFNKPPCPECLYWENLLKINQTDNIKFCTECGRKLEGGE